MKTLIYILLLLFVSNTAYCQLKPLTKKELKTLIKEGKAENKEYSWIICISNPSSKNDTLTAYSPSGDSCPKFITWHFKKTNTIHQTITKREIRTTSSGWREYTFESTAVAPSDIYNIKIIQKPDKLILSLYNNNKLIDIYEVLQYTETKNENHKSPVVTLVRQ